MDYVKELLCAINRYNDDDLESKENLRNLVCIISESSPLKADPFIKKLLYLASQKMRVFGYNIQNGFSEDPDNMVSPIQALKNEAIKESYRSKVWANNLLDKTQLEIVDFYQSLKCKRMLVSAPTSYGKTFLMREIVYLNRDNYKNILLVFPTVALLRENASEMIKFVKEKKLSYQVVKSVDSDINISQENIFVFTPERAMQLLAIYPHLNIDFFFYDEVYKIDEDYCYDETDEKDEDIVHRPTTNVFDATRAKTFRIALYLLSKTVKDYYLAGPNLSQSNFEAGMKAYLHINNIQVKEISFEPTVRIRIKAFRRTIEEDCLLLPERTETTALSTRKSDMISDIVAYIKTNEYGKTIFYCTTPTKANQYANNLSKTWTGPEVKNQNFNNFLEHIKKTYDIEDSIKEWSLVNVLDKGFAIHHGKLPKYIQTEILDQFNNGPFDMLFCTSTIIEGVNTKAKNMVILNKTKGRDRLTPFDIKNIKGRAGRYYHNFIGRIFYTDKELIEIEDSDSLKLNFATYDIMDLDGIDLDNAELEDLTSNNASKKTSRMNQQANYRLPWNVFIKNRLIPIEYQERLLQFFLTNDSEFNKFISLINNYNLTENFLKYNYFGKVLDAFLSTGLIDEPTKVRYNAISLSYYNNGFIGILAYEIKTLVIQNRSKRLQ